jgi:hypothetical protein
VDVDKLEWAVDTIDGAAFEKIAGEILRHEGYDTHESGVIGADGGWDAKIEIGEKTGIGHASTSSNWRRKLRSDAEKVKKLEKEENKSYNILVFITNQNVTGQKELDIEDEIKDNYGWRLEILHRRDIIGITGNERPDLAERHFGFNPKRQDNHLNRITELRNERLDTISDREEIACDFETGPAAVVHLIPNGIFNKDYVSRSDDLPALPQFGQLNTHPATETVGKGKLNAHYPHDQQHRSYTYLRRDGLFEAANTTVFRKSKTGYLINNKRYSKKSLDCMVGITVQAGIRALKQMGVTGTVFCSISLLNAKGAKIEYDKKIAAPHSQQPLRTEQYTTDFAEIPLEKADVVNSICDPLTEIWHELGWSVNLHYDDGEWTGPVIRFNDAGVFPADTTKD